MPRWFGRAIYLAVLAIGTFSWFNFLTPFARAAVGGKYTSWTLFLQLLKPNSEIWPETFLGGYWFLLSTLAAALFLGGLWKAALVYIAESQVPITALETKITLTFDGPLMSVGTVTRHQFIHANQFNVRAYRANSGVTGDDGKLLEGSFQAVSEINGSLITKEYLKFGSQSSKELVEIYSRALPVNPFLTYLPNSAVNFLRPLFKKSIVERRTTQAQVNEYNGLEASLALKSDLVPVSTIVITIYFHKETAPDPKHLRAFVIRGNLADAVDVIPDYSCPSRVVYRVRADQLKYATLRVVWKNKNLHRYKKRLAPGGVSAGDDVPTEGTT